ncbi:MAG: FoF1 ATP synthase subunit gamma [Hyphomicrobium sp.]|uniref:F0F1 ATP synthase subunit gamma n=1 Tax=Hyphomicrobium sp. TaxID=82 RepID=UPI0039E57C75
MSERLSDINAHITSIRELGSVVNAMRGIAGARAQQARGGVSAVKIYAESLAFAIGRMLALLPARDRSETGHRRIVVLFLAEQGFAGSFSRRLLDAAVDDLRQAEVFIVGTRGAMLSAERGLKPVWQGALPVHPASIPRFADRLVEELYRRIASGGVRRLEAWFSHDGLEKRRLFPLGAESFSSAAAGDPPLLNLEPAKILASLTADYIHAQLCDAALNAFAAENEARMEAMASAYREIQKQLAGLQARSQIVRQEEITAEIIELGASRVGDRKRGESR